MAKQDQQALHNTIAPDVVKQIVTPVILSGGDGKDVLVILESVVVGTMLAVTKLGGDNIVLDVFLDNCRLRLADLRLKSIDTAGTS